MEIKGLVKNKNARIADISKVKGNFRDITGLHKNHLFVIGPARRVLIDKTTHWCWFVLCDCSNIVLRTTKMILRRQTKSCGCLRFNVKTLPEGEAALNKHFATYNRHAKLRNLVFKINLDDFKKMVKRNCHYCNSKPNEFRSYRQYKIYLNGLDRLINTKGYVKNNVVTCCTDCNLMKQKMSSTEFIAHAKKISEYLKL